MRGERLDEGAELLLALWTGERVDYHGRHFIADGVRFLPRPHRQPHPPLWFAARGGDPSAATGRAIWATGSTPSRSIATDWRGCSTWSERSGAASTASTSRATSSPGSDASGWDGLPVTWVMHAVRRGRRARRHPRHRDRRAARHSFEPMSEVPSSAHGAARPWRRPPAGEAARPVTSSRSWPSG